MKRPLLAAAFVVCLAASARPQGREQIAPGAPAGVARAAEGTTFNPRLSRVPGPPASLSLAQAIPVPIAVAPAAVAPARVADAVSAEAGTALAAAPRKLDPSAPARTWDYGRWSKSFPIEDGSHWKFRDPWAGFAALWDGARPATRVGTGAMGTVFLHPRDNDLVVKVARKGYKDAAGDYFAPDDETVLSYEDYDLARLAAVGAAPKPLARLTVSGRPASVRERVRGVTVGRLKRMGAYGERERKLVHELLGRIADAGLVARDLHLGNIVIGRVGASEERAWLVDTLGVSVRDDLDSAGRVAQMLADPVPWIAFRGLGIGRPLAKALDAGLGPSIDEKREPIAWPRWARWTTLAALLGILGLVPGLAHAAVFSPLALGALPSWPVFAAAAAVIALAGIPIRIFAHRLAPWVMTSSKDAGEELFANAPFLAVPELVVGAAIEELLFRLGLFVPAVFLFYSILPLAGAIAAASFLSSMVFALLHGYGSVWTRVVGGMLYAGAFAVSGSLLLPVAAHFAYNLSLYVHGRYLR